MLAHPAEAYRWIRDTHLNEAATVTVCTGLSRAEALIAFGADPARPEPTDDREDADFAELIVRALDVAGGVLAVEYNGSTGSEPDVLVRLSARGLAASMFWNVNELTNFAVARGGELLAGYEPFSRPPPGVTDPDVLAALEGLEFDRRGDRKYQHGLVAVERLTGVRFGPEHLAEMQAEGVVHVIPD